VSARNERIRWQLPDLQRFLVVLAVVVAFFLCAMALGGSSLPLLLTSVVLLVAAALTVVLLRLRHNGFSHQVATAYVVEVSPAPTVAIVGKCDMKLRVIRRGGPPVEVKHRDVAMPVDRWPRVGQTLPVDLERNAKHLRVRWDLLEQGNVRAPDPTPPRSYKSAATDAAQRDAIPPVRLHLEYTDPSLNEYDEDPAFGGDYATVRTSQPSDGHDPDGFDSSSSVRAGHAEAVPTHVTRSDVEYPDFDPAEVDRSDFDPHPQDVDEAPARPIPLPRPAEQPTPRVTDPGTAVPTDDGPPTGADSDSARHGASIGGMLIVADLDRSLRYYSEKLGFTIVYATSGSAVVEYLGARILLQHMADFSGIDRRVGHLHIQVPDIEAAHSDLMAKGVTFSHRPKLVSRSDDLELWKAAFRDPDGHGIALTEWRQRRR
jgi:catechol 2,3-dioxygenase-like lactoylglutathione lyase family enzyme